MEPSELKNLVIESNNAWKSKGKASFDRPKVEKDNFKFRRSIYFVEDVKKGEIFSPTNVRRIRPGFGLEAKFYDEIIGFYFKTIFKNKRVKFLKVLTWSKSTCIYLVMPNQPK